MIIIITINCLCLSEIFNDYCFEILTRLINIQLNFNILNIYTSNNKDICQAKLKIPSTVLYVFFIYISLIQHGYLVGLFFCLIKFKLVSLTFDSIFTLSYVSFAVIQSLIDLVHCPEPEHPLRADVAEEFTKTNAKFMKNAEDFTKKNAEKRPAD